MNLLIDNLDGQGAVDYTAFLEAGKNATLTRKLNALAELKVRLIVSGAAFAVPVVNARMELALSDGTALFTGYVTATPTPVYLGYGETGARCAYEVVALSDGDDAGS